MATATATKPATTTTKTTNRDSTSSLSTTPGNSLIPIETSKSIVSLSTSILSVLIADSSGTKSIRLSLSSSCNLSEMPLIGPFWIRFTK
ncbi:hypothetical protein RND71_004065 [Anisodus tanguticus]|uniref:Uncharacterized protein n=1 Tax=Anisodus tanguticus TaxID=243964 RepID=A0AAE1VX41_9SOLA|nr:hypothetical protein RND71_004065 [Anisodus tanguticus]